MAIHKDGWAILGAVGSHPRRLRRSTLTGTATDSCPSSSDRGRSVSKLAIRRRGTVRRSSRSGSPDSPSAIPGLPGRRGCREVRRADTKRIADAWCRRSPRRTSASKHDGPNATEDSWRANLWRSNRRTRSTARRSDRHPFAQFMHVVEGRSRRGVLGGRSAIGGSHREYERDGYEFERGVNLQEALERIRRTLLRRSPA